MGSREKGVLFIVLGVIIAVANTLQVIDAEQLTFDGTPFKQGYVIGRIVAIVLFWFLAVYLIWKGRKIYREAE
jgi:hypothetical protein